MVVALALYDMINSNEVDQEALIRILAYTEARAKYETLLLARKLLAKIGKGELGLEEASKAVELWLSHLEGDIELLLQSLEWQYTHSLWFVEKVLNEQEKQKQGSIEA